MKFKYLGTAAAEGFPAMFCECDSCKKALKAGGKNIRTRSQAIVDDKLLIDFPPDTYMHVLYTGLELCKVKSLIMTHDHSDHLCSDDFGMRRVGFAYLKPGTTLTVYGTEATCKKVTNTINTCNLSNQNRVVFELITPFVPFNVEEYTVTALKADHDPNCTPVFYIIGDNKKNIMYANDTGYFPDETWDYLEKNKPYLNFVSLDCTTGIKECRHGHMGLSTNAEVKERLIAIGCADQKTVFCVHHFSHNGLFIYDEIVPVAKEYGFSVSYDGMEISII